MARSNVANEDVQRSQMLSFVLRHKPSALDVALDQQGWLDVECLLAAWQRHGWEPSLTLEDLQRVVRESDKQRFVLDGERIRANQGHSVEVDLALTPQAPPAQLFHGTATRFVPQIHREGLKREKRHHVHLSGNHETAAKVGQRHGKLHLFVVDAAAMYEQGHAFYCTTNRVWLTDHVPPEFLSDFTAG